MKKDFQVIGKPTVRVDAAKLACGKGTFVDDFEIRGLLYGALKFSPVAHARIKRIDASKARALPGVHAVLTHHDLPRIPYTTAGQGHPEPSPYDAVVLDNKVRFVGDRVAAVAAESPEIARRACDLIEVEYEELPAILDPEEATRPGAVQIHDQPDATGIHDAARNIAAHIHAKVGDPEEGFRQADRVFEGTYEVQYVQQCPLEPHVCITYFDENDRLTIRLSTQVPFHARRIVARVCQLPVSRVRVIKPRIGGGFGVKQEILIEDICSWLTRLTRRPVRLEYTREEEFRSSRTRHPQKLVFKTGVTNDGKLTAMTLKVLANTGAYGTHALTVQCNTGSKSLPLYRCDNVEFEATVVYTNLPVAGAFRGYGAPQGLFAQEVHLDEVAHALDMDPIEFRRKNLVQVGDAPPLLEALGEGKAGFKQVILSCEMEECLRRGKAAIDWDRKRERGPGEGSKRRGVGMACLMHGSGIPGVDMGAAYIKINEDGSFNLQIGATDIGTGADTVFAQIAAEVLTIQPESIVVYSSDTDFTPFDVGAYASSTTYISGVAVKKAAEQCRDQILTVGSAMLGEPVDSLTLRDGRVWWGNEKSLTLSEIALYALYQSEQFQIQGAASHFSYHSPPPFAAQFAEVEVDTETGQVKVLEFVSCIDCGVAINPDGATGQVEGGATQGLGYALTEQMQLDDQGRVLNTSFRDYKILAAPDMPKMTSILVESYEPHGPFGAKAVAEIPIDGPAPAVSNAIFNAVGVRLRSLPFTAEKVYTALKNPREQDIEKTKVLSGT
ncbi:MAG: molybdopterin cofactor-binding domain-containing protein [Candidatus Eremiobacterota bacterium]